MDLVLEHRPLAFAFALAAAISLLATPVVMRLARRLGAVDAPGERRVHTVPTPRMGGIAIAAAALVTTPLFLEWPGGLLSDLSREQMIATLVGAACISMVGVLDDLTDLDWRIKLSGQVGVAALAVLLPLAGATTSVVTQLILPVRRIDLPFVQPVSLPPLLGVAIAIIWIVALMNMVNFIDGVDGLAAGTCAISAATFAIIATSYGRPNVGVLAAATCGAAVGFLRHNFHRDGARIFMGDSGSMLLGYLLAVVSIQGVLKTSAAVALVIPLALLAVPIVDTVFVVAKRMKYNLPVSNADRWHLHHRMLNVGYTPRMVAVVFWLWTLAMSALALALRFVNYGNSRDWNPEGLAVLAVFAAAAVGLSIYLVIRLEIIKLRHVRERNARIAAERQRELEADQLPKPSPSPSAPRD